MRPSGKKPTRAGNFASIGNRKPARALAGLAVGLIVALSSMAAIGQETTTTPTTAPPTTASPTTAAPTTAAPTTAAPTSGGPTSGGPTSGGPTSGGPTSGAPTTATTAAATSSTLSAQDRQERARAVANLNLAKAADVEIAAQLKAINEEANVTVEKIAAATERIEEADAIAERSQADLAQSGEKQRTIEASLMLKAIEGFKTRSIGGSSGILSDATVNEALRQNQLLDQASSSTTELLEELRGLLEDRQFANAEAEQAALEATQAEQVLQAELEKLKDQQNIQVGLKVEAERRIDQWAGELTAYAKEDAAIQSLIGQNAAPAVVNTGINNPTTPSALGFQWPVTARVTSEYGYRVHPVYGSRRLHSGIDVGAAGGTPIASANNGVVIFAGTQGGYGRTVIVDHGGGITTLYAHMREIGSSKGQTVARGDVVGFVGASGTATGNHLHFEVRVNGGPVNPRNYLP